AGRPAVPATAGRADIALANLILHVPSPGGGRVPSLSVTRRVHDRAFRTRTLQPPASSSFHPRASAYIPPMQMRALTAVASSLPTRCPAAAGLLLLIGL